MRKYRPPWIGVLDILGRKIHFKIRKALLLPYGQIRNGICFQYGFFFVLE